MSVLRRLERIGYIDQQRAGQAVQDLQAAPIRGWPTDALVDRMWALRANLSAYDACYVALATALNCPLVTLDGHLARAPNLTVSVIVID